MRLEFALLARAAEIQNGEIYILGGGLESLEFPEFPASLFCTIVMKILLDPDEVGREHTISASLSAPEVPEIVKAEGQFAIQAADMSESSSLMLTFNLFGVVIEEPGAFTVSISNEREVLQSLPLRISAIN